MGGSDPQWKKYERAISRLFGGERRGAGTSRRGAGLTDAVGPDGKELPGWALECALLGKPTFGLLLAKLRQAEGAAKPDQLPVAVVKRKGDHLDDAVVVVRLATFKEWFLPPRDPPSR